MCLRSHQIPVTTLFTEEMLYIPSPSLMELAPRHKTDCSLSGLRVHYFGRADLALRLACSSQQENGTVSISVPVVCDLLLLQTFKKRPHLTPPSLFISDYQ
jgi:hypothetical protein